MITNTTSAIGYDANDRMTDIATSTFLCGLTLYRRVSALTILYRFIRNVYSELHDLLWFPFWFIPFQMLRFEWSAGPSLWGAMVVAWFHKIMAIASQSHRVYVSFRIRDYLCPFRWQCPVSSCSCFLFNIDSPLVLLAEERCYSPFACLGPLRESKYFLCSLFIQSLIAFLATRMQMRIPVSDPVNGCSDLMLYRCCWWRSVPLIDTRPLDGSML
jgi:hypothetical protein